MRMNRRNVLVGLGTIVAGGGAALGTGAFSSVEATRTVTFDVAGDSNALVAIEVNDEYAGDDDVAEIDLSNIGNEADGLNVDAKTTFNGMIAVTNQGDSPITITDIEYESDVELIFDENPDFETQHFGGDGPANDNVSSDQDLSANNELDVGETVVYDLTIDTNGAGTETFNIDVTVTVAADES